MVTKPIRSGMSDPRPDRDLEKAIRRALVTLDQPPGRSSNANNHTQDMNLQVAQPPHLEPIKALLDNLDLPHQDLTTEHLNDFLVAHEADDLVGVVGIERYDDAALLRSLAVHEQHRDQGLGTELTEEIEAHAHKQGVRDLYLLTTTAAAFFRRREYTAIARDALPPSIQETEEAMNLCPESATTMMKRLR